MLQSLALHVADICAAEDRFQIEAAMRRAIRNLNFASYNLTCAKSDPGDFMAEPDLTSWTPSELENYHRNGWSAHDPLLQRLRDRDPAFIWSSSDWLGTAHHGYSEYVLGAGVGGGITVPLSAPQGRFSAMTLLSLQPGITQDQKAAVQILANVAQSRLAATGLHNASMQSSAPAFRSLSKRQKEILHWAAMGKSNAEIAIIMEQSKRGIDYHISEITRKLGVTSRVQAIVIYAREQG